jgi:hypothetical protein
VRTQLVGRLATRCEIFTCVVEYIFLLCADDGTVDFSRDEHNKSRRLHYVLHDLRSVFVKFKRFTFYLNTVDV